jgi:hypothetical protein
MEKIETLIQKVFTAWQKRDWDFVESALADGFHFTSPYDDHLDKAEYRQKCWNAVKEIEEFEFVALIAEGEEAFIRYKGRVNGMAVQNTEHFRFQNGKIKEITVFFGRPEEPTHGTERVENNG